MQKNVLIVAIAGLGLAAAAQGSVTMSFADPIPGRQLHNQVNGVAQGVGLMTYDSTAPLRFLFDGLEDSLPSNVFLNARMEMNFSIGTSSTVNGVTTAPVLGFFRIFDASTPSMLDIVTGVATAGTYVRISNTNAILFSDPNFTYIPGPALLAITGPMVFTNPTEGVFTLTSVIAEGGDGFFNPDGSFRSFDANASFTGNTESAVPTPGALALAAASLLCLGMRRRLA